MSSGDIIGISIFLLIVVAVIVFFVFVVVKGNKQNKARYLSYQHHFRLLAEKYSLTYGEAPFFKVALPRVTGMVGPITMNFGLRYEALKHKVYLSMFFWRNDLQNDFRKMGGDDFAYVLNKKIIGVRKNLAFGVYFRSFVPDNLRIKKTVIFTEFEKQFDLVGESESTIKQYLNEGFLADIVKIIDPQQSRVPFYLLVYRDDLGLAYGYLEHDIIVRDMNVIQELIDLVAKLFGIGP